MVSIFPDWSCWVCEALAHHIAETIILGHEYAGVLSTRAVWDAVRELILQVKGVFNSTKHTPEILEEYDPEWSVDLPFWVHVL